MLQDIRVAGGGGGVAPGNISEVINVKPVQLMSAIIRHGKCCVLSFKINVTLFSVTVVYHWP